MISNRVSWAGRRIHSRIFVDRQNAHPHPWQPTHTGRTLRTEPVLKGNLFLRRSWGTRDQHGPLPPTAYGLPMNPSPLPRPPSLIQKKKTFRPGIIVGCEILGQWSNGRDMRSHQADHVLSLSLSLPYATKKITACLLDRTISCLDRARRRCLALVLGCNRRPEPLATARYL